MPDSRLPIYEYFKEQPNADEFYFYNENGTKMLCRRNEDEYELQIIGCDGTKKSHCFYFNNCEGIRKAFKIVSYVEFIDSIIGSNLQEQVKSELGILYEKFILGRPYDAEIGDYRELLALQMKLPIYKNLLTSYNYIQDEVKKTEIEFRSKDQIERNEFYKKNEFKVNLKVEEVDSEPNETQKSDEKQEKRNLDPKDWR